MNGRGDRWAPLAGTLPFIDRRHPARDLSLAAEPRLFVLDRHGRASAGLVADGVLWPDGTVTLRWRGEHRSTDHHDSLDAVRALHGDGGLTRITWSTR